MTALAAYLGALLLWFLGDLSGVSCSSDSACTNCNRPQDVSLALLLLSIVSVLFITLCFCRCCPKFTKIMFSSDSPPVRPMLSLPQPDQIPFSVEIIGNRNNQAILLPHSTQEMPDSKTRKNLKGKQLKPHYSSPQLLQDTFSLTRANNFAELTNGCGKRKNRVGDLTNKKSIKSAMADPSLHRLLLAEQRLCKIDSGDSADLSLSSAPLLHSLSETINQTKVNRKGFPLNQYSMNGQHRSEKFHPPLKRPGPSKDGSSSQVPASRSKKNILTGSRSLGNMQLARMYGSSVDGGSPQFVHNQTQPETGHQCNSPMAVSTVATPNTTRSKRVNKQTMTIGLNRAHRNHTSLEPRYENRDHIDSFYVNGTTPENVETSATSPSYVYECSNVGYNEKTAWPLASKIVRSQRQHKCKSMPLLQQLTNQLMDSNEMNTELGIHLSKKQPNQPKHFCSMHLTETNENLIGHVQDHHHRHHLQHSDSYELPPQLAPEEPLHFYLDDSCLQHRYDNNRY